MKLNNENPRLPRDVLRKIKKMSIDEIDTNLNLWRDEAHGIGYQQGMMRGVEVAFLSVMIVLRDDYGFGKKRCQHLVDRLIAIKSCIESGDISLTEIKDGLQGEGIDVMASMFLESEVKDGKEK